VCSSDLIGKQDRKPKPEANLQGEENILQILLPDIPYQQNRSKGGPYTHDKHDRVANLGSGIKLVNGVTHRFPEDLGIHADIFHSGSPFS
jgi:hypothetical protein